MWEVGCGRNLNLRFPRVASPATSSRCRFEFAVTHPHPTSHIRLLAIDLGDRRIGLAISDPTGTIASPAGHIIRRPGKRPPITEILERARVLEAEGFVVGLPLDQNGEETVRSAEARRVAELLGTRSSLTVRLVDERFTTAAAQRAIREMGGSTRGRKGDVDALAATVLLQHALQFEGQR